MARVWSLLRASVLPTLKASSRRMLSAWTRTGTGPTALLGLLAKHPVVRGLVTSSVTLCVVPTLTAQMANMMPSHALTPEEETAMVQLASCQVHKVVTAHAASASNARLAVQVQLLQVSLVWLPLHHLPHLKRGQGSY
jgi:hypothetical protein